MDVAKVEFIIIYVIAVIIMDIITWRIGIPLIWRIACAFSVTLIFIILKLFLGIQ
jgi:hypothetical protein